jgi:hypothetical protein
VRSGRGMTMLTGSARAKAHALAHGSDGLIVVNRD